MDKRTESVTERLKKAVKDGNVDRIRISREDETILNIPVNVGVVGGIIGIATVPWALIIGAIASVGLGCKIEIVKKDGSSEWEVVDEVDTDK